MLKQDLFQAEDGVEVRRPLLLEKCSMALHCEIGENRLHIPVLWFVVVPSSRDVIRVPNWKQVQS